jgi:hypothetical protein
MYSGTDLLRYADHRLSLKLWHLFRCNLLLNTVKDYTSTFSKVNKYPFIRSKCRYMFHNNGLLILMIVMTVGGTLSIIPTQILYSTSVQETGDEDQQDGASVDAGPVDEAQAGEPEPVDEPNDETIPEPSDEDLAEKEKDKVPTCPVKHSWNANLKKCVWVAGGHWGTSVVNGTSPSEDIKEEQQQLTLDIISSNGLVVVNETTTDVAGNGGGSGGPSGPGTAAREVTCVKNSQGQTFCYEVLQTDENCLKPINVEDPPLCLPPP